MPDAMDRVAAVLRSYMEKRIDVNAAAEKLLGLWKDPAAGQWDLYLDHDRFTPEEWIHARLLERRFQELLSEHRRQSQTSS
ncbi:MAG: hypothetical protein Q8Q14_02995 [Gemmatimonadales bacterium]|nr:hypothetical protein [Gemmatimonadales bacterium]